MSDRKHKVHLAGEHFVDGKDQTACGRFVPYHRIAEWEKNDQITCKACMKTAEYNYTEFYPVYKQ